MDCPLCHVSLQMSDRQGVEIDYCPRCRGIWLDRGELEKLIALSVAQVQTAASPPPVPIHYDDDGYLAGPDGQPYRRSSPPSHPYKKRESWLGDLLDFD